MKFLLNPYMSGDFLDSDGTEKKKKDWNFCFWKVVIECVQEPLFHKSNLIWFGLA